MHRLLRASVPLLFCLCAFAQEHPTHRDDLAALKMTRPELYIANVYEPVRDLVSVERSQHVSRLSQLQVAPRLAMLDRRADRWGTLISNHMLLPAGKTDKKHEDMTRAEMDAKKNDVGQRLMDYLSQNRASFGFDPAQFGTPRVTLHLGNQINFYLPRVIDGIPVRESYISGTIKHGRITMLGAFQWGEAVLLPPQLNLDDASAVMRTYMGNSLASNTNLHKPALMYIPTANGEMPGDVNPGYGYDYRLAWALYPDTGDPIGNWEILVDAYDGRVLAFDDKTQYFGGDESIPSIKGGAYPISNDGLAPDGVEQEYPMPFADLTIDGMTYFTNTGGVITACFSGEMSTQLNGQYMTINDACGGLLETAPAGLLDLGFGENPNDTDCDVFPGASAGNTKSSRSAFYELNRIAEIARSYYPDNLWIRNPLLVNVNIANNCNATAGPNQLNFFTSGGGCNNTGEIAGVFDHEWGHGIDFNNTNPNISSPGEGIADIWAAIRLNTPCIGRNFRTTACTGFGDPCIECTGVRTIDWEDRVSGQPHDVAWAIASCGSGAGTPCGGITHCEGQVYAEAFYDLWKRDLPNFYGMDDGTAQELLTQLLFVASDNIGQWFQCMQGEGGCSAGSGYLNFLAADDDDGNLDNGTPHMQAIYAAFDRHGIACDNLTVQDSGCAGTPTEAPMVTVDSFNMGNTISWTQVAGAQSYRVYRSEGAIACEMGKVLIDETTKLNTVDTGLANDFEYTYVVVPMGATVSCMGPASACTTGTPSESAVASFSIDFTYDVTGGDNDDFLDVGETATVSFELFNLSTTPLSNVRVVDVSADHPSVVLGNLNTPAAIGIPALCDAGGVSVSFDLLETDPLISATVQVTVDADELSNPVVGTFNLGTIQADVSPVDFLTWTFDTDAEGWTSSGTITWSDAGGDATSTGGYLRTSAFADNICDQARSPGFYLSADSTLSLFTNFDIENESSGWWDRAAISIMDPRTGQSVNIAPDGGRAAQATGTASSSFCTNGQAGFAGPRPTWAESTFSATVLQGTGLNGLVQLEVTYGTDGFVNGDGFRFDEITFRDVSVLVPEGQPTNCTLLAEELDAWPSLSVLSLVDCVNFLNQPTKTSTITMNQQ